jgi:two-component system, NarL family, sensor histidine kinase UhpB
MAARRAALTWRAVVALVVMALTWLDTTQAQHQRFAVTQAWYLPADAEALPSVSDPRWRSVALPHIWHPKELPTGGGWYRIELPEGIDKAQAQAVYVQQAHLNAAFFLNRILLGDNGRMTPPVSYSWNYPVFLPLPQDHWLPMGQTNELWVHLRTGGGFGMLSRVVVGDPDDLRATFETRRFWQAELHGGLALLLVSLSSLALSIWLMRRHDQQYLWFGLGCLAWSFISWFTFARDPWIGGLQLQWLAQSGALWWAVCLTAYIHRRTGAQRPVMERCLMLLATAFMTTSWLMDPLLRVHVFSASHVMGLCLLIYLVTHTARAWRRTGHVELLTLSCVMAVVSLASIHDVVITAPTEWLSIGLVSELSRHRFYLTPFGAPFASLFLAVHLAQRFARSLTQVERLNADLEQRVLQARTALQQSYESSRAMERDQAALQERQRIYRDLHDDLGAKLLGLAIGARRQDQREQADLAQSALQDLRDVVSRSSQGALPLSDVLADLRAETAQRLEAAGLVLQWEGQVPELADALQVSPQAALQLGRIVREAVSNIIRHAHAQAVQVAVALSGDALCLSLQDDGVGLPAQVREGRGMSNLRQRAQALQGQLSWAQATWACADSARPGCCLTLRAPLASLAHSH